MRVKIHQDKDFNLFMWITLTNAAIDKLRRQELSKYKLNSRQAAVLQTIDAINPDATPTGISKRVFRELNTISEFLVRMEKQKLIIRVKDPKDKTRLLIKLTEKGRKANRMASNRLSIKQVMSCLDENERRQLKSCLQKLRKKALELLGVQLGINWPD